MAGLMGGGGANVQPAPIQPMPRVEDKTLENASDAERLRRLRAYGSGNTIYAGGGAAAPSVLRRTLGGY